MTGTFFVTGIFISGLVFVLASGSGQSCQDLDPAACAEMARQNAKMCMDPTLATAVCPKYCHRCPITCYSCNLTTTDVSNCNTLTCTNDQVCMVKEIHSMQTGQHRYVLGCADMLLCDGESKRSVGKRSFSVDCCLDDLCNTPALITTTTSTVAPTTTATSTASPTTTSTTTIAPTTTSTSTVAPAALPPSFITSFSTTTLRPCVDKFPHCAFIDKEIMCVGQYEQWATDQCTKYCSKCTPSLPGIATSSPMTTLPPCVDKLPNCASYDKNIACVGQNEKWAIDWCPKYCDKCSFFASSLAFVFASGSGQSCQDLDPQGCADMARQNTQMCMDNDLATSVCPKYCRRCPITCYNCNSSSTDVSNCNTLTCNNDQICMVKEVHDRQTGQLRYVLGCADKLICDGARKRSSKKRSFVIDCCLDDLCNTPGLVTTTTTSTVAPTTTTTTTSTRAPTTTTTTTKAPTTTTTTRAPPPTPPHPCVDKLSDCALYDENTACVGQYEPWAIENCARFCRKCTPTACVDKLSECRTYSKTACTGKYEQWAIDWCPRYCDKCNRAYLDEGRRCSGNPLMFNGKRCASTTWYADGRKGACGCGPDSNDTQLDWNRSKFVASVNQLGFDPALKTWCGGTCGKCVRLTTTGGSVNGKGGYVPQGQSHVFMITNLCPNEYPDISWCSQSQQTGGKNQYGYTYHFNLENGAGQIAAIGWKDKNPEVTWELVDCDLAHRADPRTPSISTQYSNCYCHRHPDGG